MNFFADESLDHQIIARLRQGGHAVLDVTEIDPGISDDKVLSMANESKAILLTKELDPGMVECVSKLLPVGNQLGCYRGIRKR